MKKILLALAALVGCDQQGVVLDLAAATPPPRARIDTLAAGPYHTCAIEAGRLSCWGSNDEGELGLGDQVAHLTPTALAGLDWREVVIGEFHTCARRLAGSVWCWGGASLGQLGVGTFTPSPTPLYVSLPAPARALGSAYHHTCAVDDDGALFCWGANAEGQLAQGDPFPGVGTDRPSPARVGLESDWIVSDAGQGHTCAIRAPGALYCWGRNSGGELGIGSLTPGQIREPLRTGADSDWIEIRAGQQHTCGLRAPGSLHCWGLNIEGSLGLGDSDMRTSPQRVGTADDWATISLDTFHTCGVRRDGSLWCWGRNFEGQLGLGDTQARSTPTRVDDRTDWASVAAGRFHTCALRTDGQAFCTGGNEKGQLGLGDTERRLVFTAVTFGP